MSHRRAFLAAALLVLSSGDAAPAAAQPPAQTPRVDPGVERLRAFDPAAVERGRSVFGDKCGACHRANARGGQGFSGPDLLRSVLVLQDAGSKDIGAFLRTGHPDKNTPPIALTAAELPDIATFLHREITFAAERANYQLQYVMTGNAAAGEAYFRGAGGCTRCHSPAGDLKGIGARHDGPRLQALIVFGTIAGGRGGGEPSPRIARTATVTCRPAKPCPACSCD